MTSKIHVIGGGTFEHVRPHLALGAPAFGTLARQITAELYTRREELAALDPDDNPDVYCHLTWMATAGGLAPSPTTTDHYGIGRLVTNEDLDHLISKIVGDPDNRIVFLTSAVCDFRGSITEEDGHTPSESGLDQPRLSTRDGEHTMLLNPARKLILDIRSNNHANPRKDIFLVACKTTANETLDVMYEKGFRLCREASANLVLVNDIRTKQNIIVTPEGAFYGPTIHRHEVVTTLVRMTLSRAQGVFHRTDVKPDRTCIPWIHGSFSLSDAEQTYAQGEIPPVFKEVVDWCIAKGAFKPFDGVTSGHFAHTPAKGVLWSSRRGRDFNKIQDRDLVVVEFELGGQTVAYGAKPSAGARSQMILFEDHPGYDCVIHFHCPLHQGVTRLDVQDQWPHECGSDNCGRNTSAGIAHFGNVGAVMLDKHGPNILFRSNGDAREIISFIEQNFDLSRSNHDV